MWTLLIDRFLFLRALLDRNAGPAPGLAPTDPATAAQAMFCIYTIRIPARVFVAGWLVATVIAGLIAAEARQTPQSSSPTTLFLMMAVMLGALSSMLVRQLEIGGTDLIPLLWLTPDGLCVADVGSIPWQRLVDIEPLYVQGKTAYAAEGGRVEFDTDAGPCSRRFYLSAMDATFEELRDRAIASGAQLRPLSAAAERAQNARALHARMWRGAGPLAT